MHGHVDETSKDGVVKTEPCTNYHKQTMDVQKHAKKRAKRDCNIRINLIHSSSSSLLDFDKARDGSLCGLTVGSFPGMISKVLLRRPRCSFSIPKSPPMDTVTFRS